MWVVAAASGIPTRYSDCGFKISHSGAVNTGWETTYYHLEGAKYLSGSINQNDKIGVIANTLQKPPVLVALHLVLTFIFPLSTMEYMLQLMARLSRDGMFIVVSIVMMYATIICGLRERG